MLACLDVDYRADHAVAACVYFAAWTDPAPAHEAIAHVTDLAPYVPGAFYRRELPCLLAVLGTRSTHDLAAIVVDGYAWLGPDRPGLGAHLHAALGGHIPVIGVAKTAFHDTALALPIVRGDSQRPLYVTAVGLDPKVAAAHVEAMHGAFRLPTMLQRVDRLARDTPSSR